MAWRVVAAWVRLSDLVEDLSSPGRDPDKTGANLLPVSPGVLLVRRPLLEEVPLDVEDRVQPLDIARELGNHSGELGVIDHDKAANVGARDCLHRKAWAKCPDRDGRLYRLLAGEETGLPPSDSPLATEQRSGLGLSSVVEHDE